QQRSFTAPPIFRVGVRRYAGHHRERLAETVRTNRIPGIAGAPQYRRQRAAAGHADQCREVTLSYIGEIGQAGSNVRRCVDGGDALALEEIEGLWRVEGLLENGGSAGRQARSQPHDQTSCPEQRQGTPDPV